MEVFGAPGVLDRDFALPEINPQLRFPAEQAIGFHLVDYVVHGWDVARALGLRYDLEPAVLAAALPIARSVPDGQNRRRPGASFAPRVAVTRGGLLDQIVALLGRRPGWPALPRATARSPGLPLDRRGYRSIAGATVEPWMLTGWTWWSSEPGWPGQPRRGQWPAAGVR